MSKKYALIGLLNSINKWKEMMLRQQQKLRERMEVHVERV